MATDGVRLTTDYVRVSGDVWHRIIDVELPILIEGAWEFEP